MNNIEKIKTYALVTNQLDKFVILKKDNKGYYIEYAFIEGAPHDNRCLDWYHSFQLEAYERNGWFKNLLPEEKQKEIENLKTNRESKVGKMFRLSHFTCGWENATEERIKSKEEDWKEFHPNEIFDVDYHKCRVGCPAKKCLKDWAENWTYEQPCKCACWFLEKVDFEGYNKVEVNIVKLLEICKEHNISINEFKN